MSKKTSRIHHRSPAVVGLIWVGGVLSLGLLYFLGSVLVNDFISFRPCSNNNTDLSVVSCGKQSLNSGDFVLLLLFVLTIVLAITLFTAAVQSTRRTPA